MEISTVGQCVFELILNALDAKTPGVAIRFHNEKKIIQVIDSGEGIPPDVLLKIGETEKKDKSDLNTLGYSHSTRGQSLKQIIDISEVCIISSKHEKSPETYEKVFKTGDSPVILRKNYQTKGTSITICGFQGSDWDSALNLISFVVTSLALIYSDISFTLLDQKAEKLAVGINKPHEPYNILNIICKQTVSLKTSWHLNSPNYSNFKICGYVGFLEAKSAPVCQLFVNRRPTYCFRIHKLIFETMKNLRDELKIASSENIYFMIYIQCPVPDFKLSSYEGRTFAIFENWTKVASLVKSCLSSAIRVNYNNSMNAGSSGVQESSKPNQSFESADSRKQEEKVSRATQTSTSSINEEFNSKKESPKKIPKAKTFMFSYDQKQIQLADRKAKHYKMIKEKSKELSFNYKDRLKNHVSGKQKRIKNNPSLKKDQKEGILKKDHGILKKDHKNRNSRKDQKDIFKKPLKDKLSKIKKNPISKRKHDIVYKRPLGSHRITMTQLSSLKRNRGNLREKAKQNDTAKQKNDVAKQINFLKRNHMDIVRKPLKNKRIKLNDELENSPEEKKIDLDKIKKLKDCRVILNHLRKRESFPNFNKEIFYNSLPINVDQIMDDREKKEDYTNHKEVNKNDQRDRYYFEEEFRVNQREIYQKDKDLRKKGEISCEKMFDKEEKHSNLKEYRSLPKENWLFAKENQSFLKECQLFQTKNRSSSREDDKKKVSFLEEYRLSKKHDSFPEDYELRQREEKIRINKQEAYLTDQEEKYHSYRKRDFQKPQKEYDPRHKEFKIDVKKYEPYKEFRPYREEYYSQPEKYQVDEEGYQLDEKRYQLDEREYQLDEGFHLKKYSSMEKALFQRTHDLNKLKLQEKKLAEDFGESEIDIFEKEDNSNTEQNQGFIGEKIFNLIASNNIISKIDTEICSQLSEWSDWNYNGTISKKAVQDPESKKVDNRRIYYFLPPILNSMLRFGKTNIISGANIQNNLETISSTIFNPEIKSDQIVSRYQNLNVRLCVVPRPNEFMLKRKSLYSIEVLRQISLEFIAVITVQDNSRLLLMIDQHAADERIRYENLLHSYRKDSTKQYYTILLDQPISIPDIESKKRKLLLSNEKLLSKFGIQLKFSSPDSLIVTKVPRCFIRKRSCYSDFKLICSVRNLLLEIVESLESANGASILPKSIHDAIASEACRGAVKFGDPLTNNQCKLLIKSLRETNAPNRCAHGRPSIVPLLDVTDLKKRQTKLYQGKLNFSSLKKNRS